MKPGLFSTMRVGTVLYACLLLFVAPLASGYDDEAPGWSPRTFIEPEPWQEQEGGLPAYPEQDKLLELGINTGGQPYKIYIDPDSLTMGEDLVARYTVVIISSSGVWNVSYEGLHCGERTYRRYAYGFDGQWQLLDDPSWRPVTGLGMNRYRKAFYDIYMCSLTEPYPKAEQVLWKLRNGSPVLYE
jgi:hypothetical protein